MHYYYGGIPTTLAVNATRRGAERKGDGGVELDIQGQTNRRWRISANEPHGGQQVGFEGPRLKAVRAYAFVCAHEPHACNSADRATPRRRRVKEKKREIEAPAAASCAALIQNHRSVGEDWLACLGRSPCAEVRVCDKGSCE